MLPLPDIKTAKDVAAQIREGVRFPRYSSKATSLVFIALFIAGVAWLGQSDQVKQFGQLISIFKDDWQNVSRYASLPLYVSSGLVFCWAIILFRKELDQRLAQGLPADQLAGKVGAQVPLMQRYFNDLAWPQVRLLERLSRSGAHRLSHERLIPAFRQLAALVLAEAEQAGRQFDRAYGDWVVGQRSRKLLLSGRRLSNVVKHRAQLHWETARDDKEAFLKQSLTWRAWRRALAGVCAAALLTIGLLGWKQVNAWRSNIRIVSLTAVRRSSVIKIALRLCIGPNDGDAAH
jgi:hypothetical protein